MKMTAIVRAAAANERAAAVLHDAIRVARNRGHSLREIAEAAGMSHETVRGICSKDLNPGNELHHPDT